MSRFEITYKEVLLRNSAGHMIKTSENKVVVIEAPDLDTAIKTLTSTGKDISLEVAANLDFVPETNYTDKDLKTNE